MKQFAAWIMLFSVHFVCREGVVEANRKPKEFASVPPRGWNSYDSFSWVVDENAFLDNAKIMKERLHKYGYEYVVVDFLWYRKIVAGAPFDPYGNDLIDEWGRPYPDPARWPSSLDGRGFTKVAKKVHDMGLKFGIHCMRGMSTLAFNLNKPILDVNTGKAYWESGRYWSAKDIGIPSKACAWMPQGFIGVNTTIGAGRAFLRSLYQQYAEWGVDFVKLDCVFGEDLDAEEIITVSEVLEKLDRPVLLSISPGVQATTSMAEKISKYVNMYRITGDDWDTWADVAAHFDIVRDMAASGKIGAKGFHGKSWPDLDMLPLGWLSDPGVPEGPHRNCRLTQDEQKTQMTLWSIVKSPLMFGGDLRNIDAWTFSLISKPILLKINSHSSNNMELPLFSNASYDLAPKLTGQKLIKTPKNKLVGLMNCSSEEAKGWFMEKAEGYVVRICQNSNNETDNTMQYCLYQKRPALSSDDDTMYRKKDMATFQLSEPEVDHLCLDASVRRKPTASRSGHISSASCSWHNKQLWRLNINGTLVNSHSGLCAALKLEKDTIQGIRSWIATGRKHKGEVYLSFFNLNSQSEVISMDISKLSKFLGRRFPIRGPCDATEIWSGQKHHSVHKVSATVAMHGAALFVLHCQNYHRTISE